MGEDFRFFGVPLWVWIVVTLFAFVALLTCASEGYSREERECKGRGGVMVSVRELVGFGLLAGERP